MMIRFHDNVQQVHRAGAGGLRATGLTRRKRSASMPRERGPRVRRRAAPVTFLGSASHAIPSGSAWVDTSRARDLTGGQKPATYSRPPSRVTPLHSVGDRAVFPRKPEEIHDRPSSSVAVDLVQRSQVQILPPLLKAQVTGPGDGFRAFLLCACKRFVNLSPNQPSLTGRLGGVFVALAYATHRRECGPPAAGQAYAGCGYRWAGPVPFTMRVRAQTGPR